MKKIFILVILMTVANSVNAQTYVTIGNINFKTVAYETTISVKEIVNRTSNRVFDSVYIAPKTNFLGVIINGTRFASGLNQHSVWVTKANGEREEVIFIFYVNYGKDITTNSTTPVVHYQSTEPIQEFKYKVRFLAKKNRADMKTLRPLNLPNKYESVITYEAYSKEKGIYIYSFGTFETKQQAVAFKEWLVANTAWADAVVITE